MYPVPKLEGKVVGVFGEFTIATAPEVELAV
jgi:hypothetical protein